MWFADAGDNAIWRICLPRSHDFNGNCKSDILWRDSSGNVAIWLMNGTTIQSSAVVANVPTAWTIQGTNAD